MTSGRKLPPLLDNFDWRLGPPVLFGEILNSRCAVGRELATRLGVMFEVIVYPTVPKLLEEAKTGGWDVTFLTFDPARAGAIDFSAPMIDVEVTYLARANSPISELHQADQPGHRLAVIRNSAPDLFLTRSLKHAEVVLATAGPASAVELLAKGDADAFADNRHMLLALSQRLPGSRVVEGQLFTQQIALAVPKDRPAGLAYASEFIRQVKRNLVSEAIARGGLQGGESIGRPIARSDGRLNRFAEPGNSASPASGTEQKIVMISVR